MIPLRRLLIVQADAELPYPEGRPAPRCLRATCGAAPRRSRLDLPRHGGRRRGEAAAGRPPPLPGRGVAWRCRSCQGASSRSRSRPRCSASGSSSAIAARRSRRGRDPVLAGADPAPALDGLGDEHAALPRDVRALSDMSAATSGGYVRYIGAGAVATAGMLTLARTLPAMVGSLTSVVRGLRAGAVERARAAARRTATCRRGSCWPGSRWWSSRPRSSRSSSARASTPCSARLCGGGRGLRRPLRHRGGAHRGDRRRHLAADLGDHARDAAGPGGRVRRRRLDRSRLARRGAHGGDAGGDRRLQGGRHLSGPQDGVPGGRHPGQAAARRSSSARPSRAGRSRGRSCSWAPHRGPSGASSSPRPRPP